MTNIFTKQFYCIFLFFIIAEIASVAAFFYQPIEFFCCCFIFAFTLVLTSKKLEWGIYLALAELTVGGLGYLFFLPIGDFKLSIRLVIFSAVMSAWLIKSIKNKDFDQFKNRALLWLMPLSICLIVALIQALAYQRPLGAIFLDANNYLYLALIFPVLASRLKLENIIRIILAGSAFLALKTAVVLALFSRQVFVLHDGFYRLIRDTRVGEITLISDPLFRIFFQSHFYNLIAIFLALPLLYLTQLARRERLLLMAGLWLNFLALLISQSRTFWLAGLGGLVLFFGYLIWQKISSKKILSCLLLIAVSIITAHLMINLLIGDFSVNLFYSRLNEGNAGAGISSRSAQVKPAWEQIKQSPLIGWGFNKTITYNSSDPRIKTEINPAGLYTTDALELGYLDIWLKMGLLGLLAYGLFLFYSLFNLYQKTAVDYRLLGLLLGLIVLIAIHALTPYLNHPLGIGYLLIACGLVNLKLKPDSDTRE